MRTKQIIGYKLKDKKYERAAVEIIKPNVAKCFSKAKTLDQIKGGKSQNDEYDFAATSYSETLLKEAGVLDIWFTPVYKEEPELEVGKWYFKLDTKSILNYQGIKDGVITAYGLMWGREWSDLGNFGMDIKEWRPATDKEVEEALIQEAKKRGYDKHPHLWNSKKRPPHNQFKFSGDGSRQNLHYTGKITPYNVWNSYNGWAEIIKEEKPTKEELLKQIEQLKEKINLL